MSEVPGAGAPERPGDGWSTGASTGLPAPTIAVDVPLSGQRLQRFLDDLASDAPTPGGGAWAGGGGGGGGGGGRGGGGGGPPRVAGLGRPSLRRRVRH
jgi:hypothetical protein